MEEEEKVQNQLLLQEKDQKKMHKKEQIQERITKLKENAKKRQIKQTKTKSLHVLPLHVKAQVDYELRQLTESISNRIKRMHAVSRSLIKYDPQNIKAHEKLYLQRIKDDEE